MITKRTCIIQNFTTYLHKSSVHESGSISTVSWYFCVNKMVINRRSTYVPFLGRCNLIEGIAFKNVYNCEIRNEEVVHIVSTIVY